MASIEEQIVAWINKRPAWTRVIAGRVLADGRASEDHLRQIRDDILANQDPLAAAENIRVEDFATSLAAGHTIQLDSIGGLKNINALFEGPPLTFADKGLTVVYGDNGSGKSGYARLIKLISGARHVQPVLTNAFSDSANREQLAEIRFSSDGAEIAAAWPGENPQNLRQLHFFDEACGDDYLVKESEVGYRPAALTVLDGVIEATDRLRDLLAEARNELDGLKLDLQFKGETPAAAFWSNVSSRTSTEEIEAAIALQGSSEDALAALIVEEVRLTATNPTKEKNRLKAAAVSVSAAADHMARVMDSLGTDALTELDAAIGKAKDLRSAADTASSSDFQSEPLAGVGAEGWRALWEAAAAYSRQVAYPEHDFPHVEGGARCVLCQQALGEHAAERMIRFQTFVSDATAQGAADAEKTASSKTATILAMKIRNASVDDAILLLQDGHAELAQALQQAVVDAEALLQVIPDLVDRGECLSNASVVPLDFSAYRDVSARLNEKADQLDIETFRELLEQVTARKLSLQDQMHLASHEAAIRAHVARLQKAEVITDAQKSMTTAPTTKFIGVLIEEFVTKAVREQFRAQAKQLGLQTVQMGAAKSGKGRSRHLPVLLGSTLDSASVRDVLSEGEQTALGLAGLLTELYFDASKSALILDDPITSLDHGRRQLVAQEIARVAVERQVIVFSHDLTFVSVLQQAADEHGTDFSERAIEKVAGTPGHVATALPWKGKKTKQRISDLKVDLDALKQSEAKLDARAYETLVRLWCGRMSQTWERLIRNDVVGRVVDRGTANVNPRLVRVLGKFTEDDDAEFQAAYTRLSAWAPRHDDAEETNLVVPSYSQLQAEYELIHAFHARVMSYAA